MTDRLPPEGSKPSPEPWTEESDSPTTERSRTLSDGDAAMLWAQFKAGETARCPTDQAPLALAVDAASKSYRLVCTQCGSSSPWFEASPTGIYVRSADDTLAPGNPQG